MKTPALAYSEVPEEEDPEAASDALYEPRNGHTFYPIVVVAIGLLVILRIIAAVANFRNPNRPPDPAQDRIPP